jgi:predicted ATPase/class 3 adenylate cyclase
MGDLSISSRGQILPNGTVTFLFTDIEGSTRLAQQYPGQWETLRGRHHTILQSAMDAQHGYVFQIIGDAFCVAFHTARDGLCAAIEAQRKLQIENWGESPIKVRMGLHTGVAEFQGTDYRGYMTLARVQRVMSVAYGGQILLSNASAELTHNELPEGITLRDMKEHRLKGLPDPERLWQIVTPDLQQDFPPLQSLNEIPNNLPVQLTSFIGRKKEVEQIKKRLEKNRLVTLTGSGGVGKTRLSIQVASELLEGFPYGAWLVELAPITDPALVIQTVCTALDVTPHGNTPALNVLIEYSKPKKLMLVVDNCEHLIDASAQLCETLLHACPHVQIIASSREALGIDGESAYHVPSLSLPDPNDGLQTIEKSEAVKLFMERATAILPEFEMTEAKAPVIAQICRRLDGIALAIELAASRVKILKVDQIASRLDDAFRFLTGGSRTALPRQQTLRALIDWSYNLLTDEERAMLRFLSVFAGGWTLEAAESVCGNPNMLDILSHLVDKSLVAVDYEHSDDPRYYLLETIRQYVREKLAESGEGEAVREFHARWCVELAERAEPKLRGHGQLEWLDRIEQEHNNFRSALEWSLNNNVEAGLRIGIPLMWFWDERGYCIEGLRYMERLLAADTNASSILHADGLTRAGFLALIAYVLTSIPKYLVQLNDFVETGLKVSRQLNYRKGEANFQLGAAYVCLFRGDFEQGLLLSERSLAMFQEIGFSWGIYQAYIAIGYFKEAHMDYEKTIEAFTSALVLSRQDGNLSAASNALSSLGRIAVEQRKYEQAQTLFQEGLALARQAKNKHMISGNLQALGHLHLRLKQYEQSRDSLEECIILQKDTGDNEVLFSLIQLGRVACLQGNFEEARKYYTEGLRLAQKYDSRQRLAWCLFGVAELANLNNQPQKAATLLGAAESIPELTIEIFTQERWIKVAQISSELEQISDTIRASLDETVFKVEYEIGKQMGLDEAVAYALKELQ